MRWIVSLICLCAAVLSAACSPMQQSYSCEPITGPRSGEFYQFAPTPAADGYFHCGTGHA